jgi:hypothetical protein
MIEYDLDSFRRKFQQTKAAFIPAGTAKIHQGYVHEITTNADSHVVARFSNAGWLRVSGDIPEAEFHYLPLDSGIYRHTAHSNRFFVASRQQSKSFQVGFGNAFSLACYEVNGYGMVEPQLQQVDILSKVPENVYATTRFGFLNRFFWWCSDQLFWKDTLVGFIENPGVVHITRPEFEHSVRRAWKLPCQTPVLLTSSE